MKKKTRKGLWKYNSSWLKAGALLPRQCKTCGGNLLYFFMYDATCCPLCDEWAEAKCSDPECEFCSKRPGMPSIGLYHWQLENRPLNPPKLYFQLKYSRRKRKGNKRMANLAIKDIKHSN